MFPGKGTTEGTGAKDPYANLVRIYIFIYLNNC